MCLKVSHNVVGQSVRYHITVELIGIPFKENLTGFYRMSVAIGFCLVPFKNNITHNSTGQKSTAVAIQPLGQYRIVMSDRRRVFCRAF